MQMPQCSEAEESILSSIMIDSSTLIDISAMLMPDDFYNAKFKQIYAAILDLFKKNIPVDLVSITDHMRSAGSLKNVGGAHAISAIIDTAPVCADVRHTAQTIRDKSILRSLILRSNDVIKRCATDDAKTVLEFAEKTVFDLSLNAETKNAISSSQLVPAFIDRVEFLMANKTNSNITGVPSGIGTLDKITAGFQKSDIIILAARPSMGKTALALNIARNAAVDSGKPVIIFSLEMSTDQLMMRLMCSEARVDSSLVKCGSLTQPMFDRLTAAAGTIHDAPIFIDDAADITMSEIRSKCRRLKLDKGLGLVIIDYIQLMRSREKYERRDLEISAISRGLKILAKELDVPVIALSQLNRKLEERSDKRPMLADLRESGAIEQDADMVLFIYRDEVYNKEENNPNRGTAEIIIAKNRNGATGTALSMFHNQFTRFETLETRY